MTQVSDSHAFEITVHQTALPVLAHVINNRLAPDDRPIAASDFLALAQGDCPTELRLSLIFPRDDALSTLAAEDPDLAVSPDAVTLGYVFVSAIARGDVLDVSFYAISHALAAAMRESDQVRAFFRSLGEHATDAQVREVNEWNESRPL